MHRALFLEREANFYEPLDSGPARRFPMNWNEVRQFEGLEQGLSDIKALGFRLVLLSEPVGNSPFLDSLNQYLVTRYAIDDVYAERRSLRSPLLEAALRYSLSLGESFYLGDSDSDVKTATLGGCQSVIWDRPYNQKLKADHRIRSIWDVYQVLKSGNA